MRGGTVGVLSGNEGVGRGGGVAEVAGCAGADRVVRGGVTGGGGGRTVTGGGSVDSECLYESGWGEIFLRNFLFLFVICRDPSRLMR